jgi:hypothetical protein
VIVLLLKPNCECCDRDLDGTSLDAMICSFECTFCRDCAYDRLAQRCPNCGGGLVARPARPAALLGRFPASTERATIVDCPATT